MANKSPKWIFHKKYENLMYYIARALQLKEDKYDIRHNMGIGNTFGYVLLHTDKLYVRVGQLSKEYGIELMYKSCRDRNDQVGGKMKYLNVDMLHYPEDIMSKFRDVIAGKE